MIVSDTVIAVILSACFSINTVAVVVVSVAVAAVVFVRSVSMKVSFPSSGEIEERRKKIVRKRKSKSKLRSFPK